MLRNFQFFLCLAVFACSGFSSVNANATEVSYPPAVKWHTYDYYSSAPDRDDGQEACNYGLTGDPHKNFDGRITITFVLDPPAVSNSNWPLGHCHSDYNNGQAPVDGRNLEASLRCLKGGNLIENSAHTAWLCKLANPITVYNRKGANLGPTCSANGGHSCGEPINTANGNMWHVEHDYIDRENGNLSFSRTYNSLTLMAYQTHSMGSRWTNAYDASIQAISPSTKYEDQQCYKRISDGLIFCESLLQSFLPGTLPSALQVQRADGKRFVFNLSGTNYVGDADTNDRVNAVYGDNNIIGFQYIDAATLNTERFDSSGKLLAIQSKGGATRRLTYSDGTTNNSALGRYPANSAVCDRVSSGQIQPAGRLLCVTDDWGRQLNFEYDDKGRLSSMTDPSGHTYNYEYDGPTGGCISGNLSTPACSADNLTKVIYPDGTSHQYLYNESTYIGGGSGCTVAPIVGNGFSNLYYSMTGLVDENGARYITWNYSCAGLATGSQLAGDVNKVNVTFYLYDADSSNVARSELTTTTGNSIAPVLLTNTLSPAITLGVAKISYFSAQCAVCGPVKSRNFDVNGNVTLTYDWNYQYPTRYTYDMQRNLETSRTEALNSESARVFTTSWHPTFRLPISVAAPKVISTTTYDNSGNLLSLTKQATTDENGTAGLNATVVGLPQTWTYAYNAYGQIISMTGPRRDLVDATAYQYDAQGNLASTTNALGHTTTYTSYDANGNVGRIVYANGMTSEFSYTIRGAIASKTVFNDATRETTSYDYDPVGQLIKETLPDGSWHQFGYDSAHRLVSITDNLGNSITYTLDLTSNRIVEQVKDSNGVLVRQVAREFNALNQLTKVTGSIQ